MGYKLLTYIEEEAHYLDDVETDYLCRRGSLLPVGNPLLIKNWKPHTYIEEGSLIPMGNPLLIKRRKPLTYVEEETPCLYKRGNPLPM